MPAHRKELHYFDAHFERGVDWYQSFFPPDKDAHRYRAIGEVTPDYLFDPAAPRRIFALLPDCRLIALLRNPVERAFSGYLHHVRSFGERRSFAQFIEEQQDARERGFYARQIQRYLEVFSAESMHIMLFEEVLHDPWTELQRLGGFLRLTRLWEDPVSLVQRRANSGDVPYFTTAFRYARRLGEALSDLGLDQLVDLAKRSGAPRIFGRRSQRPRMLEETRELLHELYEPHILELEDLLGRRIEVWRARQLDAGAVS